MTLPEGYTSRVEGNGEDALRVYELDDIGNAERFDTQHRGGVRYVPEWRSWIVWDGQKWAADTGGVRVTAFAKMTARALYDELDLLRIDLQAAASESERERLVERVKLLLRHAKRSASDPGVRAMLKLAESEPGIAVVPSMLDADVHILNTPTGIIDLRTGDVRRHDPAALCTRMTSAAYDPHAACPFWLETLRLVFDGDAERIRYLQRIVGLALHGNPGERILPFGSGPGCNGKTSVADGVVGVLGAYGSVGDAGAILLAKNSGGPNEDIADLHGQRLVVLPELPRGRLNTERVKKLTGGDRIAARRLFGHRFEFKPTHTFVVFGNELPEVPESSVATWDRLRVIPFTHQFTDEEKLPRVEVERRLRDEASGILAWCVAGAVGYHRDGLGDEPVSVRRATVQYREDEDIVGQFLDECAILDEADAWTPSAAIYDAYKAWAAANGLKPESQQWIIKRLVEAGLKREKRHPGTRGFVGLRLVGGLV